MVAAVFVTAGGGPNPAAVQAVIDFYLEERTLLITCGTCDQAVRIIPPLVVNEAQIREFHAVFRRAVASLPAW